MTGDDFCDFMMSYFSPTCYTGFGPGPTGFYQVFGTIFAEIEKKEVIADNKVNYPSFGKEDDDYEKVLHFYHIWSRFSTCRSFAAADVWDPSEANLFHLSHAKAYSRPQRRAMEKENAHARDEARQQYNTTVVKLVATCRESDPRYGKAVEMRKEEEKRREEEKKRRREEEKKKREEELLAKMDACVTKVRMMRRCEEKTESKERVFRLDDSVNEATGTENLYECVACNKVFKSEKQMQNHENILWVEGGGLNGSEQEAFDDGRGAAAGAGEGGAGADPP